jgi:hypothetical protein
LQKDTLLDPPRNIRLRRNKTRGILFVGRLDRLLADLQEGGDRADESIKFNRTSGDRLKSLKSGI